MPTPRPPRPGDDCAHSEDEGSREGGPVTGLRGDAAIVGYSEWPSERRYQGPRSFQIEQWAQIAAEALDDAGIASSEVDGLVVLDLRESEVHHKLADLELPLYVTTNIDNLLALAFEQAGVADPTRYAPA